MNLNKGISTPIAILIIVVIAALAGGVFYWQYEQVGISITGLIFSECTADSDCEYLECPSRNELGCTSVNVVKAQCVNGRCKCKCVTPEYELPQPPSGDQLIYQGKVYVKTEQKYDEHIPEKYQVKLEGGAIYDYKDNIYTLKAADPHHGSYIYTKWQPKSVGEPGIDVSGWKTYKSRKYGFKISYPEDWEPLSARPESSYFVFALGRSEEHFPENFLRFELEVHKGELNKAGVFCSEEEIIEAENRSISSKPTKVFTCQDTTTGPNPGGETTKLTGQYTSVKKDNLVFLLEGYNVGDIGDWTRKEKVFGQILSTFEFIE